MHCPFCNSILEEFIFHEGPMDGPATVRFECVVHGVVDPLSGPVTVESEVKGLK